MAGSLTSIHCREISLPIPGICVTYHPRPARARRGSVTLPSEYFLGGSPPISACTASHRKVRCCATTCQSHYNCLSLGRRNKTRRSMIDCLYFISQSCLVASTYHSQLSLASIVWVTSISHSN